MKSIVLLTAAAVVATMSSITVQASDVAVYGKMNVSVNRTDEGQNEKAWALNSNASRLGVKGSHQLSDGLKAIYKAEYQTDVDGDGDTFKQRNIYAGLNGGFGTLIAGMHDTPLKLAQGKIDQFNDLSVGDIKGVFFGENREKNIIMYSSPKLASVAQLNVAIMPGEGGDDNDSLADERSVSLTFGDKNLKKASYYAAVAYDDAMASKISASGGSTKAIVDTTRVAAQVKVGPAKLGAMYQLSEESEPTVGTKGLETKGYLLSAAMNVAPAITVKAQYAANDLENNGVDTGDVTQIGLGADYKLSKKAKAYTYLGQNKQEDATGADVAKHKTFAVGMEVKF